MRVSGNQLLLALVGVLLLALVGVLSTIEDEGGPATAAAIAAPADPAPDAVPDGRRPTEAEKHPGDPYIGRPRDDAADSGAAFARAQARVAARLRPSAVVPSGVGTPGPVAQEAPVTASATSAPVVDPPTQTVPSPPAADSRATQVLAASSRRVRRICPRYRRNAVAARDATWTTYDAWVRSAERLAGAVHDALTAYLADVDGRWKGRSARRVLSGVEDTLSDVCELPQLSSVVRDVLAQTRTS